jgi:plastocyanin
MRRWGLVALVVGTAAVGLTACGDDEPAGSDGMSASGDATGGTAGGGASEVSISGFEFQPGDLTVAAGTTVTWTNDDRSPHSIQDDSDLGAEEGPDLARGDTFELTYDEPGTYPYLCGIHNYMTGTITVE